MSKRLTVKADDTYLTSDVAKLAGVVPATVRFWANTAKIPVFYTASGVRLFRRSDVIRYLGARSRKSGDPLTRERRAQPATTPVTTHHEEKRLPLENKEDLPRRVAPECNHKRKRALACEPERRLEPHRRAAGGQ